MSEPDTQAPKELREALDRANEKVAEQTTRADAAETNLRVLQASTTFEKANLNPKHADLFLKTNPDVEATPQAVADFAHEYGLAPAEGTPPPDAEETPPADTGLAALAGAAGSAAAGSTPAAQPKMSAEDFNKLLETNPDAAAQAYVEGKVERHPENVTAQYLVDKGIIDH